MSLPLAGLALRPSTGLSEVAGASLGEAQLLPSGKGRNQELLNPSGWVHTPNKVHGASFLELVPLTKITFRGNLLCSGFY